MLCDTLNRDKNVTSQRDRTDKRRVIGWRRTAGGQRWDRPSDVELSPPGVVSRVPSASQASIVSLDI
eukprot:718273-Amorphochlora_amoeboformis.AAC.1